MTDVHIETRTTVVLAPVLLNGFELDVFESLFIAASVDMMSSSVVAAVHAWHRKTHVAVALAFGLPAAFFAAFMFYFVPRYVATPRPWLQRHQAHESRAYSAGSFMTSSLEEVILGSVTIVIGSAIIIFAVIERNELEDQDLEHQQDGSGGTAAAGAAAGAAGGAVGVDGKPSASERYLINPGMPRRWVHTTLEQPDHMFTSEIPIFGVDPTHTKRPVLLATACCLVIFAGEALGMLSGILCIGALDRERARYRRPLTRMPIDRWTIDRSTPCHRVWHGVCSTILVGVQL